MCPDAVKQKTRAEKTVDETLAAVREATRAMEAEAAALIEVEKAYKRANDAAKELMSATEASRATKLKLKNARTRAREALDKTKIAAQTESWTDEDDDRKQSKLRDEKTKAAEAEKAGKRYNQAVLDKATYEAKESEQRAIKEQHNALKAKEELFAADEDVKTAEKEAALADAQFRTAGEAESAAKAEVPRVETIVQRAMKVAKTSLEFEVRAKKNMDMVVMKLRALMAKEARIEQSAEIAMVQTRVQEAEKIRERFANEAREKEIVKPRSDVYSGVVKLLIASPADQTQVQRFQERLTQIEGFRVKSVCGSGGEGTDITVLAEKPIQMVGRLNEMDIVERVSRISRKELEVALKPAH